MPSPEGYRKSLRLMKQAEKFHRRCSLVDTPGTFCGLEAEEGGVGEAITKKLIRDVKHQNTDSFYHDRRRRKWWSPAAMAVKMKCGVWKILHILYCLQRIAAILWKKMGIEAQKLLKL